MKTVFMDLETRSHVDLRERGLDNYAKDGSTQATLCSYALGKDGALSLWRIYKDPIPAKLDKALADPEYLKVAHNAGFEYNIFKYCLGREIPLNQFRDTAAMARYISLPGKLQDISDILNLQDGKMTEGEELIDLFCKPTREKEDWTLFGTLGRFNDWDSHPTQWKRFEDYCLRDCEVERRLYYMFEHFPIPEDEWETWALDQKINQRGIFSNMGFADKALDFAVRSREEIMRLMREKTGLANPNSRDQLLPWLQAQGYSRGSLNKLEVKLGCDRITSLGREVLKLRAESSKTSYKKLETLKQKVSSDGRLRNAFLYYGASRTGRWSGGGG